jgi:hypothetical protein
MPPTSKGRGDPFTSTMFGVWGTFIIGSLMYLVGGSVLLVDDVSARTIARAVGFWIVGTGFNFVAIRTALYRPPPQLREMPQDEAGS